MDEDAPSSPIASPPISPENPPVIPPEPVDIPQESAPEMIADIQLNEDEPMDERMEEEVEARVVEGEKNPKADEAESSSSEEEGNEDVHESDRPKSPRLSYDRNIYIGGDESIRSRSRLSEDLAIQCATLVPELEAFNTIAAVGDVAGIYRNRQYYTTYQTNALTQPAIDVFRNLPSSRSAVYYYTGLLVHESTHHFFNLKENAQHTVNVATVREAALELLDEVSGMCGDTSSRYSVSEILNWACNLCAELSSNNAGRPGMGQTQTADGVLESFMTCDVVSRLVSLLGLSSKVLLFQSPDMCMKTLFDASRHGKNFSWIWYHIANTYNTSLIAHLLSAGCDEFKVYVEEISQQTAAQAQPPVLATIHSEYQLKFGAITDVFNYLMNRRNPELQSILSFMIEQSLDDDWDIVRNKPNISFVFYFKLVTCSLETLRILVTNNTELITSWNVIRAIRQLLLVEKVLILPTASFTEFIQQVVEVLDPATHGVVFQVLIDLIYNERVFDGESDPENEASNKAITQDCLPIMETMINKIVRIAHASGPTSCPAQHPAISAFAYGSKLQFIIDSIAKNVDRSTSIIRHLHAIAIANGEPKAAEIVFRFLLTIGYDSTQYMYILMAFITTTAKFFPTMMEYMYRELFALKTLAEFSLPDDADKTKLHLNLLNNLRVLFEWEAASDPNSNIPYLRVYPSEIIGEVFNLVLEDTVKLTHEAIQNKETSNAFSLFEKTTKLLEAVCSVNGVHPNSRKFVVSISQWYKMMAQFTTLLKNSLGMVGRDLIDGVIVFEKLRTALLIFLYNGHLDKQMLPYVVIFIQFFVQSCFVNSQHLFGENFGDSMQVLLDETGINKLFDLAPLEEGPSIIEGLRKIRMKESALDMMHSGQLKRRRNGDEKKKIVTEDDVKNYEDQKQRTCVFLDALRGMCVTGANDIQICNSKQLALIFLDTICKDALAADMRFDDWDSESDYIYRHVEIDQKITKSPICEGIMRILSETRCFVYVLPIVKAQLAVIINEAEKNPDRSKCTEHLRQKFHKWMLLVHRSGILPSRFHHIVDLEYLSTTHESYLMMLEIWKFFMYRGLTQVAVDSYYDELLSGEVDEGLPNEKEALERVNFGVFRLIIQNHISDAYELFPKFFPVEFDFLKLVTPSESV